MKIDELEFKTTAIEYLKSTTDYKHGEEIQIILQRSTVNFIETTTYLGGDVWNQRAIRIELAVPIPLIKQAESYQKDINKLFGIIYPENESYGYGSFAIKPKIIGSRDISYKEYDVVFENIKQTIIQGIRDAKYVIWIAVAWFTNKEIFDELCKRKQDGVSIRIITIGDKSNKWLLDGLESTFDTTKIVLPGGHLFHNKFCIIDFEYVMHGSYNWSKNAEGNEETWSTAIDRDFAKKFADKFMQMYKGHTVDEEDITITGKSEASHREEWGDLF